MLREAGLYSLWNIHLVAAGLDNNKLLGGIQRIGEGGDHHSSHHVDLGAGTARHEGQTAVALEVDNQMDGLDDHQEAADIRLLRLETHIGDPKDTHGLPAAAVRCSHRLEGHGLTVR